MTVSREDAIRIQQELVDLFNRHQLNVGVKLTQNGVVIRSYDPAVDCKNIGRVEPYDPI